MSRSGAPAHILVVDDSAVQRAKVSYAVRSLGHTPLEARDGREALGALDAEPVDLVILDLMMPELDGFGVLRAMRADARLSEIPVLVVSAMEEAEDVARAIELGAADVLAKSFDPSIFAARLGTSLERRRLRLADLDRLEGARRLTEAARLVEAGATDADALGLGGVAVRQDALGDLARVFAAMVSEIRLRQAAYARQILLLRGALLLMAMAVPLALLPSMARHLATAGLHPLGVATYGISGAAIVLSVAALLTGRIPRLGPLHLMRGLQVALAGTVLPIVAVLVAARDLEAGAIALLLSTQPVLVFAIDLAAGRERPEPLRLLGIVLAGISVALVALPEAGGGGPPEARMAGVGTALLAAVFLAAGAVLSARSDATASESVLAGAARAMTLGAVVCVPVALALGALSGPGTSFDAPAMLVLSAILALAATGYGFAVRQMGPGLASQHAIPLAVVGPIWAMLLLGEMPGTLSWLSLPCLIVGLLLVMPAGFAVARVRSAS